MADFLFWKTEGNYTEQQGLDFARMAHEKGSAAALVRWLCRSLQQIRKVIRHE